MIAHAVFSCWVFMHLQKALDQLHHLHQYLNESL